MFFKLELLSLALIGNSINHCDAIGTVLTQGFEGNKDRTPVLGRGYSPASGSLVSTCMKVPVTNEPTFDYTYDFTSFNGNTTASGDEGTGTNSFASAWAARPQNSWNYKLDAFVKAENSKTPIGSSTNYYLSEMKADMYYTSADETEASFADDAVKLLLRQEYIGFLQACGPYYVRSIRREKALVTLFRYYTQTTTTSSNFDDTIFYNICNVQEESDTEETTSTNSTATQTETSLTISIFGFGLDLSLQERGSLMATSMDEYDAVMNYGFLAMKSRNAGLVKSVEIFPWTANLEFQSVAKIDVVLQKRNCYSLEDRTCNGRKCQVTVPPGDSYTDKDCSDSCYNHYNSAAAPVAYDCSDGSLCATLDKCFNAAGDEIEFQYSDFQEESCVPSANPNVYSQFATREEGVFFEVITERRTECLGSDGVLGQSYGNMADKRYAYETFPTALKQANFLANAEFIANADAIVRQTFVIIELMSQCMGILGAYTNEQLNSNWVRNQRAPVQADLIIIEKSKRQLARITALQDNQDPPSLTVVDNSSLDTGSSSTNALVEDWEFTTPFPASRLLTLLTGDLCPNGGTRVCCDPGAVADDQGCVERKHRYLYGRKIESFLGFINGFYGPCLTQLSERASDFDGGRIFTQHWVQITECRKPVCLIKGSIWNVSQEDCVIDNGSGNYDPIAQQDVTFLVDSYCMPVFI